MPCRLYWEEPRGLCLRIEGDLGPPELVRVISALTSDPRFDDLRYLVLDLLETRPVGFEGDALEIMMVAAAQDIGASITNAAFVRAAAATDPYVLDLLAEYGKIVGRPYRVFPTIAEAREWVRTRLPRPALC